MFEGYLALGSSELINAARTEAYVAHQAPGMSFKRRQLESSLLHLALGDDKYESPAIDDAPWFDPRHPETGEFYGLYPLELQGFEDSTLTAAATELLSDGAVVGSQRETSRSLRVHGLLVGTSEAGVQAGLAWLMNVVRDPGCSAADDCGAGDLSYFRAEPRVDEMVWLDQELPSKVERFGTLASGKTLIHRFTNFEAPASMPMRVAWSGQWAEGNRYLFGALGPDGETLEVSGPVTPFRRNYFPNPSLRSTTAGLIPDSSTVVSRVPGGGVNGGAGARVTGYPSGLPFGYNFGSGGFGDGGFGGIGPDVDTTDAGGFSTVNVVVPAGRVTASLAIRSDVGSTVTVSLYDPTSGTLLGQVDHLADDSWTRVAVTGLAAPGTITTTAQPSALQYVDLFDEGGYPLLAAAIDKAASGRLIVTPVPPTVRLVVSGTAGFDVDQFLIERGSFAGSFFDGDSTVSGYTATWEGPASGSSSTLVRQARTFATGRDAGFNPFLQSLDGDTPQVRLTWWGRAGIAPDEQVQPLVRILHGVHCTQGPKIIARYNDKGGWYLDVDLLFTAEIPAPFTPLTPLSTQVTATKHFLDVGEPAELDALWLYDPAGPAPSLPPAAPVLLPVNTTTVLDWRRSYIEIPAPAVAENSLTIPQLAITTGSAPISNMRLRFHGNPFDFDPTAVDPMSYCGEFLISYLPARTRLVLNGITERATASRPGKAPVSAAHLISSDIGGAPMVWPSLSCGMSYVLTVDVPTSGSHDYDLELQVATRE